MKQDLIFGPMGVLALTTFAVLAQVPVRRMQSGLKGEARFSETANVSAHVTVPNRDYVSLLELPTLFYAASLMFFVTRKVDAVAIGIAWLYVALRIAHSVIHLTYNRASHRIVPFAVSNFVLMAYWAWFFIR